MTEKTNRAAQLLSENVHKLLDATNFKAALKLKRRLHSYSFVNVCLIYAQCPTASFVAGYQQWKTHNRQVRKGEKAIAIIAPLLKKNNEGEQELFGYRSANVFDISQTDGEEITLPIPHMLEGTSEQILRSIRTLEAYCTEKNITLNYHSLEQAYGMYSRATNSITLDTNLPPFQTLKTFVHELAHALLHPTAGGERSTKELEAEATAFLVCDALGLDTSGYSFAYLANWMDDPREVFPAAQRACSAAESLIDVLVNAAHDAPATVTTAQFARAA
jgi:antirestriction protein ArdC